MKKTRFGLLAAAALWAVPTASWAQDAAEEADAAGEEDVEDVGVEGDGDGAGLGDICEIDPAACPTLKMEEEAAKPLNEKIFAVQQRFIIKKNRFELQPYWNITLNDQFVGHPGPGLALNYYITEALAVGINGNFYRPFNEDKEFNAQVRQAARIGVPLTEYDWGAALNFTYVPANGKFAGFGDFIFHYDFYVVGGVGAISTRPIPVMDPDYRVFEFEPKVAFNAGLGLKVFFNRWFAGVLEVRDYVFLDKLENLEVSEDPVQAADESTWLGDSSLTNNVQLQAGLSIFIPFSFEYRLPKAGADTTAAQ
jgi:outer membrane beta-barrel protein